VVVRDHAVRDHRHRSRAVPSTRGLPEPAPAPFFPPHSPSPGAAAFAGSAGAAGAGTAASLWCALLISCVLIAARDLRRHRAAAVLAGPAGVRCLQARPG
jgi:hypothetical protein